MHKALYSATLLIVLMLFGLALATGAGAAPNAVLQTTATGTPVTTQSGIAQSDSVVGKAVAKTSAATNYRLSARMTISGTIATTIIPILPTDQAVLLSGIEGEFSGTDYHQKQSGLGALMFAGGMDKTLEVTRAGGKFYIHGPVPDLGAPADKWYVLDPSSGLTMNFPPPDTLNQMAAVAGDWSRFSKTRSGDALDGSTCDTYSGDAKVVADVWSAMNRNDPSAPVADNGSIVLVICADGYLHNYTMSAQLHDQASPDKTGKMGTALHYSDFAANLGITAPANAEVASGGTGSSGSGPSTTGTATPTPVSTPITTTVPITALVPIGSANVDGDWQATTTGGTKVTFTVAKNQITAVSLNYNFSVNNCTVAGSFSRTPDATTVKDNALFVQVSASNYQFTLTAGFASGTQAAGMLQMKGTSTTCGAIDIAENWTGTQAVPTPTSIPVAPKPTNTPGAAPTARPAATSASASGDTGAVVTRLFDLLNARNVDATSSLFAQGSIVTWGSKTMMDLPSLTSFLTTQTNQGISYQVSIIQVTGNSIVRFTLQESGGGSAAYASSSAILNNGKISILTIK